MSVDFLLFQTEAPVASPTELTDDRTRPLGSGDEVRRRLDRQLPDIVWDDVRGHVDLLGTALELCVLPGGDEVRYLCVRSDASSRPAIAELARRLALVAFDSERGELVTD